MTTATSARQKATSGKKRASNGRAARRWPAIRQRIYYVEYMNDGLWWSYLRSTDFDRAKNAMRHARKMGNGKRARLLMKESVVMVLEQDDEVHQ